MKRPADGRRVVRLSPYQYGELGRLLSEAEARGTEPWQLIGAIRLIALTGCRRGEIEKLRWSEVDIEGSCLRLADTKTGASLRPIGRAAIELLKSLRRSGTEFVFPGSAGDRYFSGLPKGWGRLISLAPLEADFGTLTPHGLRHAFASTAHDLGLSEITIAALLGHATASITARYVHHLDSALISVADTVSGRIVQQMTGGSDELSERGIVL